MKRKKERETSNRNKKKKEQRENRTKKREEEFLGQEWWQLVKEKTQKGPFCLLNSNKS